jgi:hypothetical protein
MKNKKGLVFGIVILFLGMSIVPIVSSTPIEKNVSVTNLTQSNNKEIKTGMRGLNITLNGKMGENNWYVSPVEIIIEGYCDPFYPHFYYQIDDGNWTEYTPPVDDVIVSADGEHIFTGYYTDPEGNPEIQVGFDFRIDQTPPILIGMTVTRLNLLGTKWLFNLTAGDVTSGMAKVDFYVNDVIVGTAYSVPYEFIYHGTGTVVQAIAYDCAGNWAITPSITMPLMSPQSQSQISPSIQQNSQNLQISQLLQNLILHQQMINR